VAKRATDSGNESEWQTRKQRIDPLLAAAGWPLRKSSSRGAFRTEEEETANGPADYALWLDGRIVGIVEAKKLTIGPQNVLTQAERYARGLGKVGPRPKTGAGTPESFDLNGLRCPFLYSTNGEVIWFHDARHELNRSRRVKALHTPNALRELLARDVDSALDRLKQMPHDHPRLRPYQLDANAAVEKAIAERRRNLLVAMATGTGKTYTLVNQIYRLMKAGVARRVLFLVDRRALAAQAVRSFNSFDVEPNLKFTKAYELYSSKFQKEDFGDEERFDPKILPQRYLTDPQPGLAFVYVATIQRMAVNILGRQAVFGAGSEEAIEDDATKLDIPIHAFDLVVADECHRGYTSQELSVWRATLDHLDALKIGLTATPAAHTAAYFTHKAFAYGYEQAVRDGYLVDYDAVNVRSEVRMSGVFLKEGDRVEQVDPESGLSRMDTLEDERAFDTTEIERRITAPQSNRLILEEVKKYADEHERRYGRLPKTLVFAANDLPHTSHADQLVDTARDVFGRGDAFVEKITGRVDRPLQRIREFRNRPQPMIAVTVDLLTTGVDIPDLEFLVLLRPVKSRILFEQMLGRGTRKGERYPDKSHFTVFDCFDGTLLEYFRKTTGITEELPTGPVRTLHEIVEEIWANRDTSYNLGCLMKRLQRMDRELPGEARERLAAWVPDGDLARFARELPRALRQDYVATMARLRDPEFQEALLRLPRPDRTFIRADEYPDAVSSVWRVHVGEGQTYKPEDYLAVFSRFVTENEDGITAIRILLDRPRDWSAAALTELRQKLAAARQHFTVENLQKAHELRHRKALVDIISMVKHAAREESPLLTSAERVTLAFDRVSAGQTFTPEQQAWLERIRTVMQANLSIDREDFEYQDALMRYGGWGAARRAFGADRLDELLHRLNEAIAA
jgi:type I restriction enzyme R subunit